MAASDTPTWTLLDTIEALSPRIPPREFLLGGAKPEDAGGADDGAAGNGRREARRLSQGFEAGRAPRVLAGIDVRVPCRRRARRTSTTSMAKGTHVV